MRYLTAANSVSQRGDAPVEDEDAVGPTEAETLIREASLLGETISGGGALMVLVREE